MQSAKCKVKNQIPMRKARAQTTKKCNSGKKKVFVSRRVRRDRGDKQPQITQSENE